MARSPAARPRTSLRSAGCRWPECPECPECPVSDWTVTHVILSDLCPVLSDQCPIYVRLMSDCVSDHVRKPCPVSVRNVRQCPINYVRNVRPQLRRRGASRRIVGASRRIEAHRGVEASSFTQQHIITPSNGIEASSFGVKASRLASSLDVEASRPGLSIGPVLYGGYHLELADGTWLNVLKLVSLWSEQLSETPLSSPRPWDGPQRPYSNRHKSTVQ